MQMGPYLSPRTKLKCRITDLNIKSNMLNLMEKEVGNSSALVFRRQLPEQNTNSSGTKIRVNKRDLMKLKSYCKAKDTINRTKWQPTEWE